MKGTGGALEGSAVRYSTVVRVEYGRELEEEPVCGSRVIVHLSTATSLTSFFRSGEDLAPRSLRRMVYASVSGRAEA